MVISRDCPDFSSRPTLYIIPGSGKATNFKFGRYIHRVHPIKSPLDILGKKERGRIHGLSKFFQYGTPIISGTDKATNFKFCTHIQSIDRNKSPLQISGKVAMGVARTLDFSEHPVVFAIAQLSCLSYG